MSSQTLDRLTISTKCSESWDAMAGDDRVRFCRVCAKSVYNVVAMTEAEAKRLVFENEGSLCTRLFRREDGRVLTRDCAGEYRPRLLVNVTYAAALVMPMAAISQERPPGAVAPVDAEVRGSVVDSQGRPVEGAEVRMLKDRTFLQVKASKDGTFAFKGVMPGSYHVTVMIDGIEHWHQQVVLVAGQVATLRMKTVFGVTLGAVISSPAGSTGIEPVQIPLTDRKLDPQK